MLSDMELYVLAKQGIVTLTKAEFDELPLETIQHMMGFAEAHKEMEKENQDRADRQNRVRREVTRYG